MKRNRANLKKWVLSSAGSTVLLGLFSAALLWPANNSRAAERLQVGEKNRFLVKPDGTPFFYLGDTAWELFHRLTREEADLYLKNRAEKGFTVIQAVVLAELDGLNTPNPYGHVPLEGNDPTKPVEAYFEHVDYIVRQAQELGMFIGMLPTWGDKWNKKWGVGPEIFTVKNAEVYGEFLGNRYKDNAIIWILGGDRNPETEEHVEITRAMAKGIRKAVGESQLMTFHPQGGGNSARWFHEDEWLDFNMFQSGHGAYNIPNYEMTVRNYEQIPAKPTLDGEPRYEDHPVNWKPDQGWFDEFDARQAAYWSMLAGACGHTYGDHNIWQMWQPGRTPISAARTPWKEALDHPGSTQMGYMRKLFEFRPWRVLVPDQSILADDPGKGEEHARAARAADGSFAMVYTPAGRPVSVKVGLFEGSRVKGYWFDPREGKAQLIGEFPTLGLQKLTPPSSGRGHDWVLVLDASIKNFPAPEVK